MRELLKNNKEMARQRAIERYSANARPAILVSSAFCLYVLFLQAVKKSNTEVLLVFIRIDVKIWVKIWVSNVIDFYFIRFLGLKWPRNSAFCDN